MSNQAAYQAPPPAFLKDILRGASKKPVVKPGKDRDKIMTELADSDAWSVVKKYIEAKQLLLAKELRDNVEKASMEEIGFRFMITDQVNKFAQEIIAFVEAPKKVKEVQNERESDGRDSK